MTQVWDVAFHFWGEVAMQKLAFSSGKGESYFFQLEKSYREFPAGPVVRTLSFH